MTQVSAWMTSQFQPHYNISATYLSQYNDIALCHILRDRFSEESPYVENEEMTKAMSSSSCVLILPRFVYVAAVRSCAFSRIVGEIVYVERHFIVESSQVHQKSFGCAVVEICSSHPRLDRAWVYRQQGFAFNGDHTCSSSPFRSCTFENKYISVTINSSNNNQTEIKKITHSKKKKRNVFHKDKCAQ
ncbi:hypothetical protein BDB00DRAFT_55931 [Zychaea mexicana]|uniref:uncharacterized protein n=1 Tax=Zychaea mexicana TaxID=64656 RepID=UPI0022FE65A9|nr:uncharacterized protein BDB00DRAFT_55931 [Zychaea mexicana]KAI9488362.1 hypothetical protein BDB00DRAFT_55931 [Zychaea mexicana]